MRNMSLRKFRDQIATITEVVEVSRRETTGNINVLGFWTPYMQYAPDAKPLKSLDILTDDVDPVPGGTTAIRDGEYVRELPKVIKTPEEAHAATASAVRSVRAVPKPSQRKRQ